MKNLFLPLSEQARQDLEQLLPLIDRLFPIPGRFRAQLPRDVAELSRQLTSERPRRNAGYLGQKSLLSAYLRYFLPWNVFRLGRLLPSLEIQFEAGDAITDIGSGPLTLPIALWVCRPDLREVPLEFRCLDRTGAILDAGKRILEALPSRWKLRTIRGSLGERIEGKPARLVTAINVFNELFWDDHGGPRFVAERYGPLLSALAAKQGSILIVEPGIPRSGEFISLMRTQLLLSGRPPLAPCTHSAACPLPGGRRGAKWCHFAFETDEAPEELHRLSRAAGLPKERATVSFLLAGPSDRTAADATEGKPGERPGFSAAGLTLRVISDPFPIGEEDVPAKSGGPRSGSPQEKTPREKSRQPAWKQSPRMGRYACSERGLLLLRGQAAEVQGLLSGFSLELKAEAIQKEIDKKSGAPVINL